MDKLKLSVPDIVAATGEDRAVVFAAIRVGDLDTFLVGQRRFARPAAVRRWIDFLEAQSKKGKPVSYLHRKRNLTPETEPA